VNARRLLGKGWAFPVAPLTRGRVAFAEGPEKVAQSIQIILDTEPGERVMRPAFGCGLRRYLMAPNSGVTRALIRQDVERALTQFEPRIRLREIRVDPGDDPALMLIAISYVHTRDQRPGNLVFPFFLE
jgi:uncharacterized protein